MVVLIVFLKILLITLCLFISLLIIILFAVFSYHIKVEIGKKVTNIMMFKSKFGLVKIEVIKAEQKSQIKVYIAKVCICLNDMKFFRKIWEKKKHKTTFKIPETEFIADMFTLINKVFQEVKPKSLVVNGVYGFEDPSFTGVASAAICLIEQNIPRCEIALTPVFEKQIIDIDIEARGDLKVLNLVSFVVKFILKRGNKFWKIVHHLKKT